MIDVYGAILVLVMAVMMIVNLSRDDDLPLHTVEQPC